LTSTDQVIARARRLARDGELGKAARLLRQAAGKSGQPAPLWFALGNLWLERDRPDRAEAAYRQAMAGGETPAVLCNLAAAIRNQGRLAEAIALLERAAARAPDVADVAGNLGGFLIEAGHPERAIAHLRRALARAPDEADHAVNLAVALLDTGAVEEAREVLEDLARRAPGDALVLSHLAGAWARLGHRDALHRLVDFDRLIDRRCLIVPAEFPTLDSFDRALEREVRRHSSLTPDRAGKTTRRGAQTGELLSLPGPAIAALERAIRDAIADYLDRRPADPDHRFLARPPERLRLTAWATVLGDGGHQAPHNHPTGWLSGVYYVAVPPIGADGAGAIEFGTGVAGGDLDRSLPVRRIDPAPGMLVLFPSYFWHRTLPIGAGEERISIAFDARRA